MKVFAARFLEPMRPQGNLAEESWSWAPVNASALQVYASGASTSSQESTYANERDNRSDTDRPNEGLMIA